MLTHERELLSQLRRRDVWSRLHPGTGTNGNGKNGHGSLPVVATVLKTTEAKAVYQGLKLFFAEPGGIAIAPKQTLTRLVMPLGDDPALLRRELSSIGEPHPDGLALSTTFQILARFLILGHHERLLLEARKNGGPEFAALERQAREVEELRTMLSSMQGNGHGGAPKAPRPLHLFTPAPDQPGDRLPTCLHTQLDEQLGGGLRRKEIGLLAAPANHGKTGSLLRMATHLAGKGLTVFYASFEIYLNQIYERVKTISKKIPKTLIAEEYEGDSLTPEQLSKVLLEVKPDLFIVDYLDLLRLDQQFMVEAQGQAIRKLRNTAARLNAVAWTATQADEPYEDQMYLRRDQLYGSRQKIHAADFALGALYLPRRQVQTFVAWKSRHKIKMGTQLSHQVDFTNMQFREVNV